ncbi:MULTISPECIES: glycosyltransferase family 9 protein [unclassified Pseudoalteromonas]|uniref:glycosyltransferase family 9 protein n=1 Tax=unclassified Pseudoalteromonas TaxID=194690 RepID=UPI002096BBB9|nr:glycosyltransferase family 9 protein [Pseudoalteromonas sp. XMcav2-N]MCO7189414.1 glycosyltransferase family 9 protein [Pseudoalteromonas sp. XMcav2-N]
MSSKTITQDNVRGPILVVLPKFIGDAINTLPAIAMLRSLYPEHPIHLLARPYMLEVLERAAHYNIELIADNRYCKEHKQGMFSFARTLRKNNYALAVLFRGSIREALLAKLARINLIVGYAQNGRKPLLSHALKLNECHHYIHRYCRLVNDVHNRPFSHFELPTLLPRTTKLPEHVHRTAVYIGGKNKGTRHYDIAKSVDALTRIAKSTETHFFIVGDPSESEDAVRLCQALTQNKISVTNMAGKTTLGELVDTIAAMDTMISIDSGPMHIAAACNVPCLALVGLGTSPWSIVRPLQKNLMALESPSTSLKEHEIINDISPEMIAHQYIALLAHTKT